VLFCYGGGGPLHASALARELSIPTIIVPPEPGNFSALGMLLSDARNDLTTTFAAPLTEKALLGSREIIEAMEKEGATAIERDFGQRDVFFERSAEMRFIGQRHNIKVDFSTADDPEALRERFAADYRRRYGHASPDAAVEIIALHVSVYLRSEKPRLAALAETAAPRASSRRRVYFGVAHGWMEADVHHRASMPKGASGKGPALIEEYGSTTLIWPGDRFHFGDYGEIRIDCAGEPRDG
jgi:N-methylhydantoinase A